MRITVTTKVSEEEYEHLKRLATSKGMSMSGYLKSLCDAEINCVYGEPWMRIAIERLKKSVPKDI